MPRFEWTDQFSVGIHSIDLQHQGLFKTFNDLYEALEAGNKMATEKALGDMWQYTCDHFEYEEKYFAMHKYPDADAHIAAHKALAYQVQEQMRLYLDGKLASDKALAEFLGNWLIEHIQGTDKKYTAFFQEKGVR